MLHGLRCSRRRNWLLFAVFVFACLALAPSGRADSAAKAEKHARRIEKKLARYRKGTFLKIDLNNNTEATGSLGQLSSSSFQIVSSEFNKVQTFNYADVDRVQKSKEYIGEGSAPSHHFHLWFP